MSLRKTRPYFTKFTYDLSTETLNPAQSLTYDFYRATAAQRSCIARLSCHAVSGWMAACLTFVRCVETAKDTALVAMECEPKTVPKLSNCTISNDLEWPLSFILRFRRQTQSRSLSATAELLGNLTNTHTARNF